MLDASSTLELLAVTIHLSLLGGGHYMYLTSTIFHIYIYMTMWLCEFGYLGWVGYNMFFHLIEKCCFPVLFVELFCGRVWVYDNSYILPSKCVIIVCGVPLPFCKHDGGGSISLKKKTTDTNTHTHHSFQITRELNWLRRRWWHDAVWVVENLLIFWFICYIELTCWGLRLFQIKWKFSSFENGALLFCRTIKCFLYFVSLHFIFSVFQ